MRKADIDQAWETYRSFFPKPSLGQRLLEAKLRAIGYRRYDFFDWAVRDRNKYCFICQKRNDLIFDFAQLIPFWHGKTEEILYVCRDHGGKVGGVMPNCLTGEREIIFPARPWLFVKARNIGQVTFLKIIINLRFIWFLIKGWFIDDIAWPIRVKLLRLLLSE